MKSESLLPDIAANRATAKWTRGELARRALWAIAMPAFRLSPRPLWSWRRVLLRAFGAQIGRDAHIYPTVRIAVPWHLEVGDHSSIGDRAIIYSLGKISIGDRATVSQGAHLCAGTHDYRKASLPLIKSPIEIGPGAWICADAFIGPSVVVGQGAIVGARAVAMQNVPPWTIVAGNPARPIAVRPPPS